MSLTKATKDKFAIVFDRTGYQSGDPIVKIRHIQKGNNIVLGGPNSAEDQSNLIYLGKIIETTTGKNLLAADVWLNIKFPHVVYITGTRGSGKSFDLGVFLEGISQLNEKNTIQNEVDPTCSVLIDTQSQFWTLQYPPNENIPENREQIEQLKKWNISSGHLTNCKLYIPENSEKIVGTETRFQLDASQVKHEEWCALIKEDVYGPQGHVIASTLDHLKNNDSYTLSDILTYISDPENWQNVADSSRNAVLYKLEDYNRTGLFGSNKLDIKDILKTGQSSIFMLRDLRNEDKSLVTAIIARQMFDLMGEHHKKLKIARFFAKPYTSEALPNKAWLRIEEAHVVAPSDSPSPARPVLVEYVKRGRDAGLSLVLATQQPSAVDDRILSQVNLTLSHRLTFQADINATINRVPTKLLKNLKFSGVDLKDFGDMLRYLEAGQCFIGDHNTSRVLLSQIRPRITSHGGYSPS